MSSDVRVEIDDREVRRLMEESPKVFNGTFNREFSRLGGVFMRKFAKERLRKGGLQVRRSIAKKNSGGNVAVPVKARALGFKAAVTGQKELQGKTLTMGTSNPVALIHESGGTIRPRRRPFLYVRIRSAASARRAGVQIRRGQKPRVIRVRQVVVKPRLGYLATWKAFEPEAVRRLRDATMGAAERATAQAKGK